MTMRVMAAALLFLAACAKTSPAEGPASDAPAAIRIGGRTMDVQSKAAVNSGEEFSAKVLGSKTSGTYATIYTDDNGQEVNQTIKFGTDGSGAFSPEVYYPSDGSTVYLTGYAPADGTLSAGKVTFTIPAAADADIMAATEVSGSKTDKVTKKLAFAHKMTQVQFKIKGTEAGANIWGKLTNITVTGQPSSVELDLTASGFPITASGSDATYKAYDDATGMDISATPADAGSSLILPPIEVGNLTFTFTTEKSGGAVSKTIPVVKENPTSGTNITLAAGCKNTITLDFKTSEISVSATVGNWETGSSIDFPVE